MDCIKLLSSRLLPLPLFFNKGFVRFPLCVIVLLLDLLFLFFLIIWYVSGETGVGVGVGGGGGGGGWFLCVVWCSVCVF